MQRVHRAALLAAACLAPCTGAMAATDSKGAEVREIIVTAQKRETLLEKTPVTVSVVQAEFLEARGGTVELQKIAANVPGLVVTDGVAGLVGVSLRGVGTASSNQMFEQSIGLFIDGVYNPKPIQYRSALLDSERLEVIKGGQGVVFGESTSVGAISVISKAPGSQFEGYIQGQYEPRFDSWDTTGAVNLPLSENTALRVAGTIGRSGGYVRNAAVNADGPDEDRWAIRGTLRADPTENLSITLKGEASSVDTDLDGYVFRNLVASPAVQSAFGIAGVGAQPYKNAQGYLACSTTCGQYLPIPLNYSRDFDRSGTDIHAQNVMLNVGYEFSSGIRLTSITAWQHFNYDNTFDADLTPAPLFQQRFDERFRQITQEIRLASPNDGDLTWMAGVFALDQRDDFTTAYRVQNLFIPGLGLLQGESSATTNSKSTGVAAFAQATYALTTKLSVTGGVRLSDKKRNGSFLRATDPLGAPNGILLLFTPGTAPTKARIHDEAADVSATADYQATDELLLYASFSHGNKAGAFNNTRATGVAAPRPFTIRPQVTDSFEGGLKWRSPDGRVYLSAAGFYLDMKDFQDSFYDSGRLTFVVGNIDAKSKGFEVEGRVQVSNNLSLWGSYNYTHARLADGSVMQRAPKDSLSAGGRFEADVGAHAEAFLEPTLTYTSKFFTQSPSAAGNNIANGRTNIDVRTGVRLRSNVEVALLVENLTNSKDIVMSFGSPIGLGTTAMYNRPRTYALSIRVPLGGQ